MLDQGNAQLSAVGFYNPTLGQRPLDEFYGGAPAEDGALPYEVRWDDSLDDGDGGWKIFLPTPHLLSYNGGDIATSGISGATAIADGWYSLDDVLMSSTHVWLVLSVVDATGVASAELSPTQGQSVTGTTVHNICVAEISYTAPAAAGDQPTVVIKQSLVGALHLGSGGGGEGVTPDDVSTEFIPEPGEGEDPDGDEGNLQIKGFKAGTPSAAPTDIADYLMGVANLPANGMQLVARWTDSDGAHLVYLPLGLLFRDKSGQTPADMTVEFVADSDWYASDHVLRKRLKVLNLRTGAVTDKVGTTYNNGWEVMAQTTPISSIIGSN